MVAATARDPVLAGKPDRGGGAGEHLGGSGAGIEVAVGN